MKGEADLKQETQDVVVTVQPEMGTALTVGSALVLGALPGAAAQVPVGSTQAVTLLLIGASEIPYCACKLTICGARLTAAALLESCDSS